MIENKDQLEAARKAYKQVSELQVDMLANKALSVPMRGLVAAALGGLAEGVRFTNLIYEKEKDNKLSHD